MHSTLRNVIRLHVLINFASVTATMWVGLPTTFSQGSQTTTAILTLNRLLQQRNLHPRYRRLSVDRQCRRWRPKSFVLSKTLTARLSIARRRMIHPSGVSCPRYVFPGLLKQRLLMARYTQSSSKQISDTPSLTWWSDPADPSDRLAQPDMYGCIERGLAAIWADGFLV